VGEFVAERLVEQFLVLWLQERSMKPDQTPIEIGKGQPARQPLADFDHQRFLQPGDLPQLGPPSQAAIRRRWDFWTGQVVRSGSFS
jgi:hypothetical protein